MGTPSQESVTRLARHIFARAMANPEVPETKRSALDDSDAEIEIVARQSLKAARIFETVAVSELEAAQPAEALRREQRLALKREEEREKTAERERRPPHAAPRSKVGIF